MRSSLARLRRGHERVSDILPSSEEWDSDFCCSDFLSGYVGTPDWSIERDYLIRTKLAVSLLALLRSRRERDQCRLTEELRTSFARCEFFAA
jgi:hypothetical protein